MNACSSADLFCQLLDWLIRNIDVPLVLLVGVGIVYMAWLDGHTKGHRQGFIDGIMHHIHVRAYNAADFPAQYQPPDRFLEEAQRRLARNLRPRIPADIRDMPLP